MVSERTVERLTVDQRPRIVVHLQGFFKVFIFTAINQ